SAAIQVEDSQRFNRLRGPGEPARVPLYDVAEVEATLKQLKPLRYDTPLAIAPGITIKFVDAGHILGAASILMTVSDGPRTITIAFPGDIGMAGSPITRAPVTPAPADCVLLESTYGDRDHRPLSETKEQLLSVLIEAQDTGGKVLLPAFAVGRTQD